MRWRRPLPRRPGGALVGQAWTDEEAATVRQAVERAPSTRAPAPWSLQLGERTAHLREVTDADADQTDPDGRERGLACGAALTNLALAIRHTGWAIEIRQESAPREAGNAPSREGGDADRDELMIVVTATHRQAPTATDGQRFRAIARQSSHRRPFQSRELSHLARDALETAGRSPAVSCGWVTQSQARALAVLLAEVARAYRRDHRFHRDVAMWTVTRDGPEASRWGPGEPAEDVSGRPATAASSAMPRLPGVDRLSSRIAEESILGLSTPSDTHEDHIHAGEAMQHAWLAATSLGLAASAITRPFHRARFRADLREQLGVPGHPQVLLRFGYPTVVPGQRRS